MTKRIFKNIIIVTFCSVFILISLFLNVLYDYFKELEMNNLRTSTGYLVSAYKEEGLDYFKELDTNGRITLISKDGDVLYDSYKNNLENHIDRKEIKEAIDDGEAFSERYSKTMGRLSIYYAKLLDDGNILRTSIESHSVTSLLLAMSSNIFWIILIVLIIAFIFAKRLALIITKPINKMDLSKDMIIAPYKELNPLVNKIVSQNITIKEQLNTLKAKALEFNTITSNMQEGLIIINAKAKIISANNSALKIFGINDIKDNDTIYIFNRDLSFQNAIINVLKGEASSINLKINNNYYDIIFSPVLNSNVSGAIIVIIDVTLKMKNEKLRREFSANVSHELKTPLTSISGFAEIMKDGLVDPKDYKDFSLSIYNESQRLISLVNDILHLSKLDSKALEYQKEEVDLKSLTLNIIHKLQIKNSNNVSVEVKGDVSIITIRYMIEEVLYNLIENSLKYSKPNGHTLVSFEKINDECIIKVIDDGIGIKDKDLSRIFERFYRADKSHSKQIEGSGLGLAIVKHSLDFINGCIHVESKVDEGTTFIIHIK